MSFRSLLLGVAAGAVAGYTVVRLVDASRIQHESSADARRYGRLRRAFAVSDVLRSTASSIAFSYGPPAERIASMLEPLPAWSRPGTFAALTTLAGTLLDLPVAYTEGYKTERRFGLTEQSVPSYLADTAKAAALEAVVAAVLATAASAVLRRFPRSWPVFAAVGALALYALANIIVPVYIMPLFNRFEKLQGPLEVRLRALASRYGVGDAEILTMNMSKQTKKANAFVAGIGQTHRIVLGDTLLDHFEPDEIEFVIAHELGHYVTRDTWRLIAAAELSTVLLLAFTAWFSANDRSSATLRVARLAAILGTGAQLLRPAMAAFSRSREWAADRFALAATQNPQSGIAAFERLRDQNLAEDDVPSWYEWIFATHPSLGKRIAALRA